MRRTTYLHPLHHPIPVHIRKLLLALLRLHLLLHLKRLGHIDALLHRGPLLNRLEPFLQLRERFGFDAGPLGPIDLDGSFSTGWDMQGGWISGEGVLPRRSSICLRSGKGVSI